jgi:hypothetical protein
MIQYKQKKNLDMMEIWPLKYNRSDFLNNSNSNYYSYEISITPILQKSATYPQRIMAKHCITAM